MTGFVITESTWKQMAKKHFTPTLRKKLHLAKALKTYHGSKEKGTVRKQKTICKNTAKAVKDTYNQVREASESNPQVKKYLSTTYDSLEDRIKELDAFESSSADLDAALKGLIAKAKSAKPTNPEAVTDCYMNRLAKVIFTLQTVDKATRADKKKNAAVKSVLKLCRKIDDACADNMHFDDYAGILGVIRPNVPRVHAFCKKHGLI